MEFTPQLALWYCLSFAMRSLVARALVLHRRQRTRTAAPWVTASTSTPVVSRACLFGSKAAPGNPPGEISLYDEQNDLKLDLDQLRDTVSRIRQSIGYPTFDVTLILVDDKEMKSTNKESRGINEPTDILSFPFHDAVKPGVLEEVKFDVPDYYMLGEMLVDVPYVVRACEEDRKYLEEGDRSDENDDDNDDDDEEYEDERGVSGAMARVFDPAVRINMLLVHGMLHLVGHDHEEDDEYEIMVKREEEILRELGMPLPSAESSS